MSVAGRHPPGDPAEAAWVGEVLRFWFEELSESDWFAKGHHIDAQIRQRFLALHGQIASRDARDAATPRALLATVIVLDQFARNLFRDTPQAYATDPIARRLSRFAIEQGCDAAMRPAERMFLYMPFQHSENRDDQADSVRLFAQLGNDKWTEYAVAHQRIIERFGRFPHRNAILSRQSSAAELALLQDPMGSF